MSNGILSIPFWDIYCHFWAAHSQWSQYQEVTNASKTRRRKQCRAAGACPGISPLGCSWAEYYRDLCKTPIHRSSGRQTAAFSNEIIEAAFCRGAATPVFAESNARTNQAGLVDRPVLLATDFVNNYADCLLRRTRSVLAPNGSSSNAPAIIVVGSGTTVTMSLPEYPKIE
jgi:hypothetical protein